MHNEIDNLTTRLCALLSELPLDERVTALNGVRSSLHEISPFQAEPVDLVRWLPAEAVFGNDYNPNRVAAPEMRLLEHSITVDGYTQPIVAHPVERGHEVVDGFHRHLVGRYTAVSARVHGYLPVTTIKTERADRADRIAATIRHNRARGKHVVNAMSEIVVDLARRNWSDEKIARELGMDADEVLRLKQVSGLAELFADRDFSRAWEPTWVGENEEPE
jgi:ParB-like chromosome segregation protein Spo0J